MCRTGLNVPASEKHCAFPTRGRCLFEHLVPNLFGREQGWMTDGPAERVGEKIAGI